MNITCPKCGKLIGTIITADAGLDLLCINGIMVRSLYGVCECGIEIHWSAGDRLLAELILRVKQLRGA